MDAKSILAVMVGTIASITAAFLIIFGAITDIGAYITIGVGILSSAFGSVITYYYTERQFKQKR